MVAVPAAAVGVTEDETTTMAAVTQEEAVLDGVTANEEVMTGIAPHVETITLRSDSNVINAVPPRTLQGI